MILLLILQLVRFYDCHRQRHTVVANHILQRSTLTQAQQTTQPKKKGFPCSAGLAWILFKSELTETAVKRRRLWCICNICHMLLYLYRQCCVPQIILGSVCQPPSKKIYITSYSYKPNFLHFSPGFTMYMVWRTLIKGVPKAIYGNLWVRRDVCSYVPNFQVSERFRAENSRCGDMCA